jgi:hypothetical protein
MAHLRGRFWLEAGLATVCVIAFAVTLAWHDWIEEVFHVDPDGGNGAAEWVVVAVLLVAATGCAALARSEWRRAHPAVE